MLVVATRPALLDLVRDWHQAAAHHTTPLARDPQVCSNPALIDRYRPATPDVAPAFLVLDLGSADIRSQFLHLAQRWHADYPMCSLLYAAPLLDPDAEFALIALLLRLVGGEAVYLPLEARGIRTSGPQLTMAGLIERFNQALRKTVREHLYGELEAALLARIGNGALIEKRSVLNVLKEAPRVQSDEEYCTWRGVDRRNEWRRRNPGQRSCGEMIRAFRLLWAVRLRELNWSPVHVARFLGYEDASDCARKIGAPFEMSKREVDQLTTALVLQVYTRYLIRTVEDSVFNLPGDALLSLKAISPYLVAAAQEAA